MEVIKNLVSYGGRGGEEDNILTADQFGGDHERMRIPNRLEISDHLFTV